MIKVRKNYTQNFDTIQQRVVVSSEQSDYYLLGFKVFSLKWDTKEDHVRGEDKKMGFK